MKYIKRVWFSLIALPAIIAYAVLMLLPAIWKGEVDDESWNPFNE